MNERTVSTSQRRHSTIEDVATAAGVSIATVSRALRGLPNVAESTRTRVEQVATDMAYQTDPMGSRLRTGRSRSVGVAVPLLNLWYFSQVVAGVEAVCAEAGYDTVVIGVGPGHGTRSILDGSSALHRRVDGLILVEITLIDTELSTLQASGLALASVGSAQAEIPSIGIDDVEVGYRATTHLLELGHRRIGMINQTTRDPFRFIMPHQRPQGFERALREAGIDPDPSLYEPGNFTVNGGAEAMRRLLAVDNPPTAVFALADEMAFGAIQAARELGVRIPEDVSIIGVDDHELAPVVGLTTVRQDVEQHGARAARLLLAQFDGIDVGFERRNAPIELIIRSSTGPPHARV